MLFINPSAHKGDDLPVEKVSWRDAVLFANRLSEKEGRERCYELVYNRVVWNNPNCSGWRLPTEEEWEYAARGGSKNKFNYKYSGSNSISEVAWFLANTDSKQPVGRKKPNVLGLFDMSGNVWEWCADWYHDEYFQVALKKNPIGPDYGTEKVVRGGSWFSNDSFCDIGMRYKLKPDYRDTNFGFRCVKDI